MADPVRQMLVRIGMPDDPAGEFTTTHGINTPQLLSMMDDERIKSVIYAIRKPGGGGAGHAVPEPAEFHTKLAVYYIKHQYRVCRTLDLNSVDINNITKLRRQKALEEGWSNDGVTPPTVDPKDMALTFEVIKDGAEKLRGIEGHPLSYLMRENVKVQDEASDPVTNYASWDAEMVARAPIVPAGTTATEEEIKGWPIGRYTETFRIDMVTLWEYLYQVFANTEVMVHCKSTKKTKNGREMYLLAYKHYFGENNLDYLAGKAERAIQALRYYGERRNHDFNWYIGAHKKQHNVIEGLVQYGYTALDGRQKTRYLLDGIKAQSLNPAVANIMGNSELRTDFEKCTTYIMDFIRQMGLSAQSNDRNLSALKAGGGGGGRQHGTYGPADVARDGFINQRAVDKCTHITQKWYPTQEYNKMNAAERQKVYQNRHGGRVKKKRDATGKEKGTGDGVDFKELNKNISSLTRHIAALHSGKKKEEESDDDQSLFHTDEEDEDDRSNKSNRTNEALVRQKGKQRPFKKGKKNI